MNIAINGFEAVIPRFGFDKKSGLPNRVGSSEFCFQILVEIEKIDKKNSYIIYLPTQPTPDMPPERENWRYEVIPSRMLWTLFGLTRTLITKKPNIDVFFSPTHYSPPFVSIPQVISILDVSYKYYPELFNKMDLYKLALWGGHSVKRAQRIITISQASKDDIIKMYHKQSEKVDVVYPGIKDFAESKMTKAEFLEKYQVSAPYVLFVGTLQPRKNIKRLIEAFSIIKKREKVEAFSIVKKKRTDLSLVVVGKKGWLFEETLDAPKKYNIADSVVFLDSIPDSDLPSFYENAEVFVLPSLYEGFGLPIIEAMKYGCPVITSNVSSMPEAGGNAAIYVDPENPLEIADKIEEVVTTQGLREKMIKMGHEQVKKFSWETAARETLKVIEEVGGKDHGR